MRQVDVGAELDVSQPIDRQQMLWQFEVERTFSYRPEEGDHWYSGGFRGEPKREDFEAVCEKCPSVKCRTVKGVPLDECILYEEREQWRVHHQENLKRRVLRANLEKQTSSFERSYETGLDIV